MNAATPRGKSAEEVAAGVAHDFNNVLTVIAGNLALAERHAAGNPKLIRLLNNIRLAAERASDLTGELMNAAKPAGGLAGKVDATVEKPAKILVVEDDPDVAEVAVAVLEMPGPMNGIDLAEAILKRFPDLPVLLATGFSNAALAPGALRFPVLAKPYSVQELTRRVGQMIEAEA